MRLTMLCARDGMDGANEWAQATLHLYRKSLENPFHFASQPDWKTRFVHSMRELSTFIERGISDIHEDHS
ncbi:hypothetical protein [Nitrospira sp. BLG_2]|uniref:hypothetical protein n=1 Tax=Nitrospira sp. BLG_2 TaxID=3397507 RepID=UPI003B9C195F